MLQLIVPTKEYIEAINEMRREILEKDADGQIHGGANLDEFQNVEDWLAYIENLRKPETCPAGFVDADVFLVVRKSDNVIVGIADLRHHINHPILSSWAGQIGYSVRPSERRKGYAKIILQLLLGECLKQGIQKVLLTCRDNNIASERTILSCGGVYERSVWVEETKVNMKRFWITVKRIH